jgi:hypothetical protein
MTESFKKTICVDFDGVLNSYTSGWQGADVVSDPPVDGAIEWLKDLIDYGFEVCIYSSRSKEYGGIQAMRYWLMMNQMEPYYRNQILFPTEKPSAWLTIDDRAICFNGTFPTIDEIDNFKPWNKR